MEIYSRIMDLLSVVSKFWAMRSSVSYVTVGQGKYTDGILLIRETFAENIIGLGAPLLLQKIERRRHQYFLLEERQRRYTSFLPDCDTSTLSYARQRAYSLRSKYCAKDAKLGILKQWEGNTNWGWKPSLATVFFFTRCIVRDIKKSGLLKSDNSIEWK